MSGLPAPIRLARAGDLDAIADLHARSRIAYHCGFVPEGNALRPRPRRASSHGLGRYLASAGYAVFCAREGGNRRAIIALTTMPSRVTG